jgi:catechol 2,3-dioxygenase-like lactoylglutathione lyase family enzyme
MIGYVMVGASDLSRSAKFYDAVLAPLGLIEIERTEDYVGYAEKADQSEIEFYVTVPFNQ